MQSVGRSLSSSRAAYFEKATIYNDANIITPKRKLRSSSSKLVSNPNCLELLVDSRE